MDIQRPTSRTPTNMKLGLRASTVNSFIGENIQFQRQNLPHQLDWDIELSAVVYDEWWEREGLWTLDD